MDFLSRLDRLKASRGETNAALSKNSGIPYTTIDGLYKKGYENVKLSTLEALCAHYGVTLDYLVKGEEGQPAEVGELTAQEERFVWLYGQLGDGGQELIDGWLSLLPSSRRVVLAVTRALLREQAPPPVPRD